MTTCSECGAPLSHPMQVTCRNKTCMNARAYKLAKQRRSGEVTGPTRYGNEVLTDEKAERIWKEKHGAEEAAYYSALRIKHRSPITGIRGGLCR